MFITEENSLKKYGTPYRLWQGIPGIEVTKKGRIFSTFYSGGKKEEVNKLTSFFIDKKAWGGGTILL